jgi:hypothetical protein
MTSGFDEHDLVRALNAPATPAELADEATYRALFRAEGPTLLRPVSGRTVRRVGTASTLAVAFALAGAGVAAAAYSSHLPAPVQGAVHRVLGPIGVPAAEPQVPADTVEADQVAPPQPEAPAAPAPTSPGAEPSVLPSAEPTASATSTPEATGTPDPTVTPEGTPAAPVVPLPTDSATPSPTMEPSASPTASATPTESPSASPTNAPSESVSPTASPTESPTVSTSPSPAAVSISAAVGHQVAPGQTTVFSGVVSGPDGSAVPNAEVVLQEQIGSGWREVGVGTTARDGSVTLTSAPADQTARYRIKVQDVRSAPWRLVLKPTLTATSSTSGSVASVSVTAAGGRPGSPVLLMTRRNGEQVVVTSTSLGSNGRVRFTVPAPAAQSWYVVRIVPTGAHTGATTRVLVDPGVPQPTATPSP